MKDKEQMMAFLVYKVLSGEIRHPRLFPWTILGIDYWVIWEKSGNCLSIIFMLTKNKQTNSDYNIFLIIALSSKVVEFTMDEHGPDVCIFILMSQSCDIEYVSLLWQPGLCCSYM